MLCLLQLYVAIMLSKGLNLTSLMWEFYPVCIAHHDVYFHLLLLLNNPDKQYSGCLVLT